MKNNKGYTLAELVIVMAVSAIVLSMFSIVVISINNFIKEKNRITDINKELIMFKSDFGNILENYQVFGYNFNVNDNVVTIAGEQNSCVITYDNHSLISNNETIKQYSHIDLVIFQKIDNLLRCSIKYGKDKEYLIVYSMRI